MTPRSSAKRKAPFPFTVKAPSALPAERDGDHWTIELDGRAVRLSNLDKIYWPERGYTKGDLLAYYYNVAPLILPHVTGRPLVLKRKPEGIHGSGWLEKDAPAYTPSWVPRCVVEHEAAKEGPTVGYLMIEDTASLLFVANLGAIDLHPVLARCDDTYHPDAVLFDLDPAPPATVADACAVALHVRTALDRLELPCAAKTSGATGIHVFVGIDRGPSYEQVRRFATTICRLIARADPGRVTLETSVAKRAGKVYLDPAMNRRGQNVASAYSVRPVPSAAVSTPVHWDEVESGVDPEAFTIATVHRRFARAGDLFGDVLDAPADLVPALERLGIV